MSRVQIRCLSRKTHNVTSRKRSRADRQKKKRGKPSLYLGCFCDAVREGEREFSDSSGVRGAPVSKRPNGRERTRIPSVDDDRAKISCNFLDERPRACSRNLSIGSRARCVYYFMRARARGHTSVRQRCTMREEIACARGGESEREDNRERDSKGTIREIVGRLSLLFEDNNGSIRNPGRGHIACRWIAGNAGLFRAVRLPLAKARKRCYVIDRSARRKATCLETGTECVNSLMEALGNLDYI